MAPEKFSLKGWVRRALTRRTRKPSGRDTPERPNLLNIPAELRNQIYEQVLLEKSEIMVTPSLREPGLLQACRQTGAEAREIWYLRNRFRLKISDTDSTLLHAFLRYRPDLKMKVQCEFDFWSRRDWSKLMLWCAGVHEARLAGLEWIDGMNALATVVVAALDIAFEMHGQPWEKCEHALKSYRRTAGLVDSRWLVDY